MLADSTVGEFFAWGALLLVIEMAGPVLPSAARSGPHGTRTILRSGTAC